MLTRMQRKRLLRFGRRTKTLCVLAALLVFFSVYGVWRAPAQEAALPVFAAGQGGAQILGAPFWKEILFYGIPSLKGSARLSPDGASQVQPISAGQIARGFLQFFTNVDSRDLRSLFYAELPAMTLFSAQTAGTHVERPREFPRLSAVKTPGKPLVGIYHTHTAESFIPSSGVAHRPGGQKGEICEVGAALVEALASHGIGAVQDTTINDYPSFMKAYGASEVTAKRMLEMYPSLEMLFDVHRDAEKRENVVTEIGGENVARFSIIVAQGQEDLPQPHWQENHTLAKRIAALCDERYPGLCRGIQLVEWRYNQHLHPHALLLEIGSHETSTEEGERAVRMLAEVLAEILADGAEAQTD